MLLVAVFLAWLGDVFLLWDLNRGGDFFLCSNLCFLVLRRFGKPDSKALARLTSGAYFVGLLGVVFSMSI